ncbi:hypothetical protein DFH07DRAFT_770043 [Mycena maculata]|uniref:Uncharacterized protein n=1 Tax=Mycena maculata TaxID=230809 RepID=A0AAD7JMC3_9AGAR|nr:hypothetical protein DFH07DRAFT_770043 [Mycena maculata]
MECKMMSFPRASVAGRRLRVFSTAANRLRLIDLFVLNCIQSVNYMRSSSKFTEGHVQRQRVSGFHHWSEVSGCFELAFNIVAFKPSSSNSLHMHSPSTLTSPKQLTEICFGLWSISWMILWFPSETFNLGLKEVLIESTYLGPLRRVYELSLTDTRCYYMARLNFNQRVRLFTWIHVSLKSIWFQTCAANPFRFAHLSEIASLDRHFLAKPQTGEHLNRSNITDSTHLCKIDPASILFESFPTQIHRLVSIQVGVGYTKPAVFISISAEALPSARKHSIRGQNLDSNRNTAYTCAGWRNAARAVGFDPAEARARKASASPRQDPAPAPPRGIWPPPGAQVVPLPEHDPALVCVLPRAARIPGEVSAAENAPDAGRARGAAAPVRACAAGGTRWMRFRGGDTSGRCAAYGLDTKNYAWWEFRPRRWATLLRVALEQWRVPDAESRTHAGLGLSDVRSVRATVRDACRDVRGGVHGVADARVRHEQPRTHSWSRNRGSGTCAARISSRWMSERGDGRVACAVHKCPQRNTGIWACLGNPDVLV